MKLLEKQEIFCQGNTNTDPKRCHQRGLIPGPLESFSAFTKRATQAPHYDKYSLLAFHLQPDWIAIHRKPHHLSIWEGAATWIEELPDQTRSCSIQIKPSRMLSLLYREDEILSHEMIHAVRLFFDEPRFEEILAFQTSSHFLRRYFGPLFIHPKETLSWILLVFLNWTSWMTGILLDHPEWGLYTLSLPLCGVLLALIRLVRSQSLFARTLSNIKKILSQPEQALSAMLYLTDQEIKTFATQSSEEILSYIRQKRSLSPRWAQWSINYLD